MKKKLLIFSSLFLCIVGCPKNNNTNTTYDTKTSTVQVMEKNEVTLNFSNYLTYIDVSTTTAYSQTSYEFSGCLKYAFYENAVITIKYNNGKTSDLTEKVILNAAGNGYFNGSEKYSSKVDNVSGKIIYWI